MFSSVTKIMIGLCMVLSLSLLAVDATNNNCIRPCRQQVCSNRGRIVWASDGRKCYVYQNLCHFRNARCQRPPRPVLRRVPKARCQRLCNEICPKEAKPVCAEYKGTRRTFENRCQLTNHICKQGQIYREVPLTACVPPTKPIVPPTKPTNIK